MNSIKKIVKQVKKRRFDNKSIPFSIRVKRVYAAKLIKLAQANNIPTSVLLRKIFEDYIKKIK